MTVQQKKKRTITAGVLVLLVALLAAYPQLVSTNYYVSVGVSFLVFAALGSCWNIIGGYAGQTCWCMASFMAIGSYTGFILDKTFGISPWIGLLVAAVVSALAAYVIGMISFRHRGVFFSLITIAFTEVIRILLIYAKPFTGGANGLFVTYKQDSLLRLTFRSDKVLYYILLAVLILSVYVSWKVKTSRLGYYLRAISADQDAVESLGIDSYKAKMRAFIISAVMASAIGLFYAYFLCYIDPTTVSALAVSTKIGSVAIVGGIGTLFGPVIGAAILIPLTELANVLLGSTGSGMLLYGAVLMIVIIFRPGGVMSFFQKDYVPRRIFPRRKRKEQRHGNS